LNFKGTGLETLTLIMFMMMMMICMGVKPENSVLRRIFGHKKDEVTGGWKTAH
jgi:hypothetical protein